MKQGKRVFQGTAGELIGLPEFAGGIMPLELVRALLIERTLIEAVESNRAAGLDPANMVFSGEILTVKRFGITGLREESFTVRRRDGLVSEARIEIPSLNGEATRVYAIRYLKYDLEDGVPYPSRFEIISKNRLSGFKLT